jgi:hypothetical protein
VLEPSTVAAVNFRGLALPLVLLASAILAAPAGAQEGAVTLASTPRATVVGAAGGWTAWSAHQGGSYRLTVRSPAGAVSQPEVDARGVPFDLDLGTDGSGRVLAAYSRCATEPTLVGGANATAPNYSSGKGCRISLLDLANGTELRLPRSAGSASDVLPSVGGNRIAFAAVPTGKRGRTRAELRWRTLTSARAHVIESGARRTGPPTVAGGPAGIDTDGTRVAVIWRYENRRFHDFNSVLRVGRFSGQQKQVSFGVNGEACGYDQVLAPTLVGKSVLYLETEGSGWALERTPVGGTSRAGGLLRPFADDGVAVTSGVVDGNRFVVAETRAEVGHAAGATEVRELPMKPFGKPSNTDPCA